MTAMEEYFPFITKAYEVLQYTSWAILFLILVWQLFRAFGGPLAESENPWQLMIKGAVFAFLISYAKPIFALCLDIARAPYTAMLDLSMTGEDFTFAGIEQTLTNGLTTLLGAASIVGTILILIMMIALGWNYFKLLLETVERYIVVGVLCYTSPLAYSLGASKATSNVFKSWCRMVGSQLLLLVMNVWFLRGFSSSVGQFIGNGGALSNGMGSEFLWMFCALAYLKCAQRFDSYLGSIGMNVAQTGSSMGMEMLMAAKALTGLGGGVKNAASVFSGGAANGGMGGFVSGLAAKFNPNSYVRDAVVDGGSRMGFSGGAGFVARTFGGMAARNGATLSGNSIASVAGRKPESSGSIAGDIADRSLKNYMPHMAGFQLKGTQISGGHISTTATGPDGKKSSVEMFSASQYEKPDVPHSVVTAQDGSQWYQMASGEGRGAFYDTPDFGSGGSGTDPVTDNPSGGAADVPADSDAGADEMGADTSVQPVAADVSEVVPAPVAEGGTGDAVPATGDALPDAMPAVPADVVPSEDTSSNGSIPAEGSTVPAIPSADAPIATDAPVPAAEGEIPVADSDAGAEPGEGIVPATAGAIPAIPEGETDALPIAPGESDAAEPIGEAGMVPGDSLIPEGSIPAEVPAGDASAITADEAPVDGEIPAKPGADSAAPVDENPIVAAVPPVVPIGSGDTAVPAEETAVSEGIGHSIAPTDISDSAAPSVPAGESVAASDTAPGLPHDSDEPVDSSGAESDAVPAPGTVLPGAVPSDGITPTEGSADRQVAEAENALGGLASPIVPGAPGTPATLTDLATSEGEMQVGTASEGERLMASDTPAPISTDIPRSPESIPTADHPEPADVHSEDVPAAVMPDGESLAAADAPAGIPTGTVVPAVSGDPVPGETIGGDASIASAGDHPIGTVPADRDAADEPGAVPVAPAGDVPTIPQTEVDGATVPGATIPGSIPGEATSGTVSPASSEGIRGGSVISDASGSVEPVGAVPHGTDSSVLRSGISGVHDTHPVVGSNGSDMIPKAPAASVVSAHGGSEQGGTIPGGISIGTGEGILPAHLNPKASSDTIAPQKAAAVAFGAAGAGAVFGAAMTAGVTHQGVPAASALDVGKPAEVAGPIATGVSSPVIGSQIPYETDMPATPVAPKEPASGGAVPAVVAPDTKPMSTIPGSEAPIVGQYSIATPSVGTQIPGVAGEPSGTHPATGIIPMPGVPSAVPPATPAVPAGETASHTEAPIGEATVHPGPIPAVPRVGAVSGQSGVIPSDVTPAEGGVNATAGQTQLGAEICPAAEVPVSSAVPGPADSRMEASDVPGAITVPVASAVPVSETGSDVVAAPVAPQPVKGGEPAVIQTAPAIPATPAEVQSVSDTHVPGTVPEIPAPVAGAYAGAESMVPAVVSTSYPMPVHASHDEIPHGDDHDAPSGFGGSTDRHTGDTHFGATHHTGTGDSYHGAPASGDAAAHRAMVASVFPDAQEGTMMRNAGEGMIEVSNPDGSNTMWYNSAFYQEPSAPHSIMNASNGVQWYAMDPQAQAPRFEQGDAANAYNQALFRQFMPGYDQPAAQFTGDVGQNGRFEVRNMDGSGTAFYDTARYQAPRGEYRVVEDSRGGRWYAIQGQGALERRPVYENGKPVYDGEKIRTVMVETVRYRQLLTRHTPPEKRGDIQRKTPRRKR